jgi:hypothetical protein
MKFPQKFSRWISGASGTVTLGTDVIPATKIVVPSDNVLAFKSISKNGSPVKRVILAGAYFNSVAHSPPALNVSAYVWDDALGFWIACTGSATAITPGDTTAATVVPGVPVFFDIPVLSDSAPTGTSVASGTDLGSASVLFIISNNSASAGEYRFVAGPVLNEKSLA